MALSLGSALATRVYLGATEIDLAYFGATQVYTSSAFSAEAQNYFGRLDTAGDTTYVDYKLPLANYIDSLVTLGGAYWDDMLSSTSFVGVGIQGIIVPLRDGMTVPTQNNFVVGDLDQLTGLKGDASTKYIGTGINNNEFAQNDFSSSVFITDPQITGLCEYAGVGNVGGRSSLGFRIFSGSNDVFHGNQSSAIFQTVANAPNGFYATSRSSATGYTLRNDGTSSFRTVNPQGIGANPFSIFAGGTSFKSSGRLATYHAGPALNLATLEGLQATLLSEVVVAKGAAAAANYFARLDTAGDTTYVPYKQPLTNYISSLVALGGAYWDTMESAASFVGVGIQGITVPLRNGMTVLTQNNFVAADLDQLTGLLGDASTKSINTNWDHGTSSQDDFSVSVYPTTTTTTGYLFGAGRSGVSGISNMSAAANCRNHAITQKSGYSNSLAGNISGSSRSSSTGFNVRSAGTDFAATVTSEAPLSRNLFVFSRTLDGSDTAETLTDARLATYHAGPALNLATLEGLQATLLAEVAGVGFSTEAANYFGRLVNAGDSTFLAYRQPLANYIDSLVALGGAYWDTMLSATSFVGVGLKGIVVPLRDGMTVPTNNNFVVGDLDQLTGLKGDGSTKYIDTSVNSLTSLSLNDASISTYLTADRDVGVTSGYIGAGASTFAVVNNATGFRSRHFNSTLRTNGTSTSVGGLIGISRDNASDYDWYDVGATGTNADVSAVQSNLTVGVFATTGSGSLINSSRLATYHVGPALDLATLEGLQDTLITEIAAI